MKRLAALRHAHPALRHGSFRIVLAQDGIVAWVRDDGQGDGESSATAGSRKMWVALVLAVAAGAAIKIPALVGIAFDPGHETFYPLNASFFILP